MSVTSQCGCTGAGIDPICLNGPRTLSQAGCSASDLWCGEQLTVPHARRCSDTCERAPLGGKGILKVLAVEGDAASPEPVSFHPEALVHKENPR